MSEIWDLSTTDASNNDSAFGFPENMNASDVNDNMRRILGSIARWYGDTNGTLVSAGTGSAYTIAGLNRSLTTSYSDGLVVMFQAHTVCASAPTLAVDGKTAKTIMKSAAKTVSSSDIIQDQICLVAYESTLDAWQMLSPVSGSGTAAGDVVGPASATDSAVAQFDGTTGKLLKNGLSIGTSANNLVQLNGSAELPAVSGANLTNLPSSAVGANIIINGDMRIAQRGTSFAAHSSGNYHLDRWGWISSGSQVVTISQDTSVVPNNQTEFSLKVDVTTADASVAVGDYAFIEYKVEGYDCLHLGQGKASPSTVTISFDVRSPKTGVHCLAIRNTTPDRSYVAEFTVSSADTWESKTVTITLDTTGTWNESNGIGMRLSWGLMVGSTYQTTANTWTAGNYFGTSSQVNCMDNTANNFYLANVKLEKGSSATTFVPDNYATSLAKCQRYYQTKGPGLGGFCVNTTTIFLTSEYAPEMRTTPTLTLLDTSPTVQDSGSSRVGSSSAISTSSSGTTGSSVQINGFTGLTADKPINTFGQTTAIYSASAEL